MEGGRQQERQWSGRAWTLWACNYPRNVNLCCRGVIPRKLSQTHLHLLADSAGHQGRQLLRAHRLGHLRASGQMDTGRQWGLRCDDS